MDILEIIKFIIENSSPLAIVLSAFLAVAWCYSFYVKQYSGLQSINIKNKEILIDCIKENFKDHKNLYVEEIFNSYYKNGITFDEINYILNNSLSPRLNLIQYKRSISYVNFDKNNGYSLKIKWPSLFYFAEKHLVLIFILSLIIASISLLSSLLIVLIKNDWLSGVGPLILFLESALLGYSTININIGMTGAIKLIDIKKIS